jgi:hypothetical protein
MFKLTTLTDALRGGAWPPPARAVKCPVKSGNERDPRSLLQISSPEGMHPKGTAGDKPEEGAGNGRSVCPESPRLHAAYNAYDKGLLRRKVTLIPKPTLSSD